MWKALRTSSTESYGGVLIPVPAALASSYPSRDETLVTLLDRYPLFAFTVPLVL